MKEVLLSCWLWLWMLGQAESRAGDWSEVGVEWGLSDASATVGRLFLYSIPDDAFRGRIDGWEVGEAGTSTGLPNWLLWSAQRRQFSGVPGEADLGSLFISVTAVAALNATHGSKATDVFSVVVRDDAWRPRPRLMQEKKDRGEAGKSSAEVNCGRDESVLSVGLQLSAPTLTQLKASERVRILEAAAYALKRPISNLRLFHRSYLRALGHSILRETVLREGAEEEEGVYVLARMGCGASMSADSLALVHRLEERAKSGELSGLIGYEVPALRVFAGKLLGVKRKRQSGYTTPTPVARPTPATLTPQIRRLTTPIPTPRPRYTRPKVTERREFPTRPPRPPQTPAPPRPRATTKQGGEPSTRAPPPTRPRRPTTRSKPRPTLATTTPLPPPPPTRRPRDKPPRRVNSMTSVTCRVNRLCSVPIPPNLFRDEEDKKNTYQLELSLEPNWNVSRRHPNWMFLTESHRRMIGFQSSPGPFQYRLGATDSSGLSVYDSFNVQVVEAEEEPRFNHKFSVRIDRPYSQLSQDVREQVKLIRKLAGYFGDRRADAVEVLDLKAGSTILSWANNSLPYDPCPKVALERLRDLLRKEDGTPQESFKTRLLPDFPLLNVALELSGPCDPSVNVEDAASSAALPPTKATTEESGPMREPYVPTTAPPPGIIGEDHFIATVLPILIICVLVLIAVLVACCLYRRSRKGKESREERSEAFVSKGAPVIFPDEVEPDEKDVLATTPMLVKEERAPLPMPDLSLPPPAQTHHSHSHSRTPARAETHEMPERRPLNSGRASTTEHENPLYRPPPPLNVSSRASPRPPKHAFPHQREPPPYVPP